MLVVHLLLYIIVILLVFFFFFNDTATTEIYTLSLTTLFRSNSGWKVDHSRITSHQAKESTISSRATPAKWSVVILRNELPEVWIACICTVASSARMSGVSSSFGQLSCRFWRVLKWP